MPVCIAGMHRSGTSMVARLLNLCGLYLGKGEELLEPASDNPAGYWENTQFSVLNEKILARLGGAWDVPPPMAAGWESQAGLAPLRVEAEKLVDHFQASPVWGWKDPRNSLTLPFWKSVIPDLKVVICLRHPLAVAWSLNARGQSSLLFGLALWLSYNRPLIARRSEDWIITHYDAYFDDPARELRRVVSRLGLEVSEAVLTEACHSVNAPLHHQRAATEDFSLSDIPGPIIQLYETLCAQAEWTDDILASNKSSEAGASLFSSARPSAEDQPAARLMALERLLLEKDRAVAFLNTQLEERERAVTFLNAKLEERERAVTFLNSKLEERERTLTFLNSKLKERERTATFLNSKLEERERTDAFLNTQLEDRQRAGGLLNAQLQERTQALDRLQQEHADLQQELQAARTLAETTTAELENLQRSKFYRAAEFYWRWRHKLQAAVLGQPAGRRK